MSDLSRTIREIQDLLDRQIKQGDLDVVDIVPIPMHGDRMVRLRTLEEALDDFNHADTDGTVGYLVQVKPRRAGSGPSDAVGAPNPFAGETAAQIRHHPDPALQAALTAPLRGDEAPAGADEEPASPTARAPQGESIYLADGKLNLPFLMRNAEMLRSSGDYALARNIYKAILQSGERTAAALLGIARCFEAENRLEEARINYEESIAYHPNLEAYRALGALLVRQKKDEQAAEVFERALNLKDTPLAVRFELHKAAGNCWMRANQGSEAAERHYLKALELNAAADDIRANQGALALAAGQLETARRHFQEALAVNARNAQAIAGLASCALAGGDKRGAHDLFAKSLDCDLNNATAVYYLVKCAYEIKSYATAARIVEEYIQVAPVNANLLYSLAGLQYHLGRADEARATCRRILELAPAHSGAKDLLALIDR